MSRNNRRIVFAGLALILSVSAATLLTLHLEPEVPELTGNADYEAESPGYRAGGKECEPSRIEKLQAGERAKQAVSCENTEEQHRLEANNLLQQRRSADAAEAMTILTYQQTRIAVWGIILGFITMIAAVAAAIFAGGAAAYAKQSKDAFVEAERAILRADGAEVGVLGVQGIPAVAVFFKNIGRTAARITKFGCGDSFAPRWVDVPVGGQVAVAGPPIPESRNIALDKWYWIEYSILGGGTKTTHFKLSAKWIVDDGYLGSHWLVETSNPKGHQSDT